MTFKPDDRVEVYDGDMDAWYAGRIESEAVMTGQLEGQEFWVVRLDDGPVQFETKIAIMAVPFSRPEWIRRLHG